MIYLDSNATTRPHPEVVEAMLPFLNEHWHNPSSGYRAARRVRAAIDEARERVAALIGAGPAEIVFTGCGTEANNMALGWLAQWAGAESGGFVTSAIEHSAVLRPAEALEADGFAVERCGVDGDGRLRMDAFRAACREVRDGGGGFASVMWANNETGVLQPVGEACEAVKECGMVFHTDAIQAVGKVPVDVRGVAVDFLSVSAHKFHGPKGVGALYVRGGMRFGPMLRGGGQEAGRRSGTENVPGIVGMGMAAELMRARLEADEHAEVRAMRDEFEAAVLERIPGTRVNGDRERRLPGTSHISVDGCEAAGLLILLDEAGIQCSAGSACMTGKQRPSHVQLAMGIPPERAKSSLRFGFSVFNRPGDVAEAVGALERAVAKLRSVQGPPGMGPVQVWT
jgi:cysteine desulfurase